MGYLLNPVMLQSSLPSLKQVLFFTQVLHLLCRSGREIFRVGTEPPAACPAVGPCRGVPSLLEAWAEAGDQLSRMPSVMQSPFSLLHIQISPTCWSAFDKGGSLSSASFLLARLTQQLAGICSSSSFARFTAAEILPPAPSQSSQQLPPTRVSLQGGLQRWDLSSPVCPSCLCPERCSAGESPPQDLLLCCSCSPSPQDPRPAETEGLI